jgi:hypothetical protein
MKLRKLVWAGLVASMGELINTYRTSVGIPEENGSFVNPMRKWKDIIEMNLMEIGYMSLNWIYLVLYRGDCGLF